MLEVGRIVKPHGLKGEVIVELFTNRNERVAPGSELTFEGGTLVVERSSVHQKRWLVKFAGIDSPTAAEDLRDKMLTAEAIDDPDAIWVHELVGSEVKLPDGTRVGAVKDVVANPAGDILDLGANVLVPLRFVTDHRDGEVTIDPPEGLLEINN